MTSTAVSDTFHISDNAAKRIAHLMAKENRPGVKLRVSISGGGCSGFQYNFDFDDRTESDDRVFEKDGASVVIDSTSLEYLSGALLDYVEALGSAAFEIRNPNAKSSCGCGSSFSL